MTDIRLICLDMDGTLLDDDHATVPARNIRALRAASEQGAAVAIASGRGWSLLREVADQVEVVRYAVLSNGAAVLDVATGEWLYRNCLEETTWRRLVRVLLEEQLPFEVYCEGENVIQRNRFPSVLACALSPQFQGVLRRHTLLPEDLEAALEGRAVEKFHIYRIPEERRAAVTERVLACGPMTSASAFPGNLELTAPGVNKGAAVQRATIWSCSPGRAGLLPWPTPQTRPRPPRAMSPALTRRPAWLWRWSGTSWIPDTAKRRMASAMRRFHRGRVMPAVPSPGSVPFPRPPAGRGGNTAPGRRRWTPGRLPRTPGGRARYR